MTESKKVEEDQQAKEKVVGQFCHWRVIYDGRSFCENIVFFNFFSGVLMKLFFEKEKSEIRLYSFILSIYVFL